MHNTIHVWHTLTNTKLVLIMSKHKLQDYCETVFQAILNHFVVFGMLPCSEF